MPKPEKCFCDWQTFPLFKYDGFMATVILDRDGVINHDSISYIKKPSEWGLIDGSAEAIRKLNRAGYFVAVATNQSGLGRGLLSLKDLNSIHDKMNRTIQKAGGKIDYIAFCPHLPQAGCDCRKPQIGLLKMINKQNTLNQDTDWMVGDTYNDVTAGHRMGIRSALVETGKGQAQLDNGIISRETIPVFKCLNDFASWLLAQ